MSRQYDTRKRKKMSLSIVAPGMAPVTLSSRVPEADAVRLTRKEKELLEILVQNAGRCVTREALLKTVWNYADGARTRTVDVHVQRLRRKLGRDAASSIKTIVRIGYCWFPDPQTVSPVC
jgi:two-component system, OmpR family, alkaline phosphatase synthesis response regulator PhoP